MHLPPPSSIHLHPAHFNLHPPPSSSFQPPPNSIQLISTSTHLHPTHYFSQFPTLNPFLGKFGPKNSKLFILTENRHTWYIEDADSYSENSFLNCQPWIHFWANLGWKSQSCLFCLKMTHKHMHTQYLEDADSYFDISFLKFQT